MINNKQVIGIIPRVTEQNNQSFIKVAKNYYRYFNNENYVVMIIIDQVNLLDQLSICDGIIITGGYDINPTYYNENNDLNLSTDISDELDLFDKKVIEYCYKTKIPMLGICRGMQGFGAFLEGGKLVQDLAYYHISHPTINEHEHYVEKVNNYGIAEKLPDHFMINSFHHQAILVPPKDFIVLFKNGDTIEAMQSTTHPIIAFQWHPERYFTKESDIIFAYFKELINERKNH